MARKKSPKKRSKSPARGGRAGKKRTKAKRSARDVTVDLERIADEEEERVQVDRAGRRRVSSRSRRHAMVEPDFDAEPEDEDDRSVIPLPWERGAQPVDDDDDDDARPARSIRRTSAKAVAEEVEKPVAKRIYPKLAEHGLDRLIDKLERARQPLFKEWREVIRAIKNEPAIDDDPHVFCTRKYNQMRITDLEALSIARAFRDDVGLGRRLRDVKERIAEEVRHLKQGRRRQNFTCPLLDGHNCMVHQSAKPVGCLAWQPGGEPSEAGWRAFNQRNHYNDRMINIDWDITAIPLALEKYIDGEKLEPGEVRVSEARRRRSRHPSDSTDGPGRRGTARLPERERRRSKKKRGKKRSAKKAGRRGAARQAGAAPRGGSTSGGSKKSGRKKASGRRRSR